LFHSRKRIKLEICSNKNSFQLFIPIRNALWLNLFQQKFVPIEICCIGNLFQ
jgi:hypothetical protein